MRTLARLALCLALFPPAAPAAAIEEIIVDDFVEIPRLEEEVIPVQPSQEDIWIPGSWEREPGKWTWLKGRWEKPPHRTAHWKRGHWAWKEGKWHWRPGHWSIGSRTWIVDQVVDVPYAFREIRPPKPADEDTWIAGYWNWDRGGWFWVPGHYTQKPHPDASWVPGHWEPYGAGGGYWWMVGHWRVN